MLLTCKNFRRIIRLYDCGVGVSCFSHFNAMQIAEDNVTFYVIKTYVRQLDQCSVVMLSMNIELCHCGTQYLIVWRHRMQWHPLRVST